MIKKSIHSSQPLVSIIIRTKNEARWISSCLRSVFNQTYTNFEVLIVDNCSTDHTLDLLKSFNVKVLSIKEFFPGKAINYGIQSSNGEYLVCLSGHCIPTSVDWLTNLVEDLVDPHVAGVYGRQEPLSFSSDLDKRDLLTVFGLDKKIQIKDYFFHNANSAFRKDFWLKYPFDESVTNIEDRVWGRNVINDGYKIVYQPTASVYHWHGINHDLNPERARKIVRILESFDESNNTSNKSVFNNMNIVAIVPIRGKSIIINNKKLLEYTLKSVSSCKLISKTIVSTDDPETAKFAESCGASAPFLRPPELSESYIDVKDVLQFSIDQIQKMYDMPDIVVSVDESYPFRPPYLIDNMISHLITDGLDTVIAAKPELRGLLLETSGQYEQLGEGIMPRELKNSRPMISLTGLACVTHTSFVKSGEILGKRLGVYEINDPLSAEQIRDEKSRWLAEEYLDMWWRKHYFENDFLN